MLRSVPRATPKIAYLIKCFPRLSETFILNEVLELEQQGLPLRIYSLLEPADRTVIQAAKDVRATVTYVPRYTPRSILPLLATAGRRLAI